MRFEVVLPEIEMRITCLYFIEPELWLIKNCEINRNFQGSAEAQTLKHYQFIIYS